MNLPQREIKQTLEDWIGEIQAEASSNITNTSGLGWTGEQGIEIGRLMQRSRKKAVASLLAKIEQHVLEARKDELEKIEPLTHNGRGTILWEMDALADSVTTRISELDALLNTKEAVCNCGKGCNPLHPACGEYKPTRPQGEDTNANN